MVLALPVDAGESGAGIGRAELLKSPTLADLASMCIWVFLRPLEISVIVSLVYIKMMYICLHLRITRIVDFP